MIVKNKAVFRFVVLFMGHLKAWYKMQTLTGDKRFIYSYSDSVQELK
jgi:hypothetical protein